jgi:hypothetical protein
MAAPLAFQIGQIAHEFKTDLLMALAARREDLSPDERYLVGQAMLRVNYTIYSAFGNDGRAFKKLSHRGVHFLNNKLSAVRKLIALSMQFIPAKLLSLDGGRKSVVQLCLGYIASSRLAMIGFKQMFLRPGPLD